MADFYLQIRTNSMTLKNLETHEEHSATGEFSTQRMVVGDFLMLNQSCINWCVIWD